MLVFFCKSFQWNLGRPKKGCRPGSVKSLGGGLGGTLPQCPADTLPSSAPRSSSSRFLQNRSRSKIGVIFGDRPWPVFFGKHANQLDIIDMIMDWYSELMNWYLNICFFRWPYESCSCLDALRQTSHADCFLIMDDNGCFQLVSCLRRGRRHCIAHAWWFPDQRPWKCFRNLPSQLLLEDVAGSIVTQCTKFPSNCWNLSLPFLSKWLMITVVTWISVKLVVLNG